METYLNYKYNKHIKFECLKFHLYSNTIRRNQSTNNTSPKMKLNKRCNESYENDKNHRTSYNGSDTFDFAAKAFYLQRLISNFLIGEFYKQIMSICNQKIRASFLFRWMQRIMYTTK